MKQVKDIELKEQITVCGFSWTAIKKEGGHTYFLCDSYVNDMEYGENNNYKKSQIRAELLNGRLLYNLKKEFGDGLVPITIDLMSLDGLKDYGEIKEDDELALLNIELYRECRENIPQKNYRWWLSTPHSTPSGWSASCVVCVDCGGSVSGGDYVYSRGVRPFFILQSDIFVS